MAETSGSSLPVQTVPTRAANIGPARLEWRFGAVSSILQSAFEDCQLGALHSSPRNGLLIIQLFAITFNNRPLSHDRKVIITRDVCSGQPPLSGRVGYCVTQACVWVSGLTSSHCVVDEWAWWLMCHTSLCVGVWRH